jgi:class 3 adenylate cyclase
MRMFEEVIEVPVSAPATKEPATPAQDAAELLRKAAYRVGQHGGWTQHYLGRLKDGTGTYVRTMLRTGEIQSRCMLGALYCEYDRNPAADIHLAYQAIVRTIGTGLVADWNDAPERTQEDVVGALLHAAEVMEA